MKLETGGVALQLRFAAPHRIVLSFVTGAAYAVHTSRGAVVAITDGSRFGAAGGLLVLLTIAVGAVRLWMRAGASGATVRQSVIMGIGGAVAGGAVVLQVMTGNWAGLLVLALVLVVGWLAFLPPYSLVRCVPLETEALLSEGVLIPVLGYISIVHAPAIPWSLLSVTLLVAAAGAAAGFLQEPVRDALGVRSTAAIASPLAAAVGSLVAVSAAIGLVLAGGGPGLRPESALLSTPVAIMATVFGWLALADPRPEWRYRRLEFLIVCGALGLHVGMAVILLFA